MESKFGKAVNPPPPPPPASNQLPAFIPPSAQQEPHFLLTESDSTESTTSGRVWVIVVMGLLVVGGLAFAMLFLMDPFGTKKADPAAAPTTAAPQNPAPEAETTPPAPTGGWVEANPQAVAAKALEQRRSNDAASFERMMGGWVVQLASAKIGSDDKAFLSKSESLADTYGAYLSTTEDFYNRRETGDTFWVVFADQYFSSKEQAEAWCSENGLGEGDFQLRELKRP